MKHFRIYALNRKQYIFKILSVIKMGFREVIPTSIAPFLYSVAANSRPNTRNEP